MSRSIGIVSCASEIFAQTAVFLMIVCSDGFMCYDEQKAIHSDVSNWSIHLSAISKHIWRRNGTVSILFWYSIINICADLSRSILRFFFFCLVGFLHTNRGSFVDVWASTLTSCNGLRLCKFTFLRADQMKATINLKHLSTRLLWTKSNSFEKSNKNEINDVKRNLFNM